MMVLAIHNNKKHPCRSGKTLESRPLESRNHFINYCFQFCRNQGILRVVNTHGDHLLMLGIRLQDRSGMRRPVAFVGLHLCWLLLLAMIHTSSPLPALCPCMYPDTSRKDCSCYHTYDQKLMCQRPSWHRKIPGAEKTSHSQTYVFLSLCFLLLFTPKTPARQLPRRHVFLVC